MGVGAAARRSLGRLFSPPTPCWGYDPAVTLAQQGGGRPAGPLAGPCNHSGSTCRVRFTIGSVRRHCGRPGCCPVTAGVPRARTGCGKSPRRAQLHAWCSARSAGDTQQQVATADPAAAPAVPAAALKNQTARAGLQQHHVPCILHSRGAEAITISSRSCKLEHQHAMHQLLRRPAATLHRRLLLQNASGTCSHGGAWPIKIMFA